MAFPFRIVEHTIPAQHIREYPAATANSQEETLYLSVKQYIPHDNPNPQLGDVTILGAHANGFPKELYEPLWEEIYTRSKTNGFRIRSIWMADVAHQGKSSVINEERLGNDPSWFDHPRDLLHFINLKRDEMPRPIVGIGHSFGGAHMAHLSSMHPRLLHTLILLDPVIQRQTTTLEFPQSPTIAKTTQLSTYRRDLWPSRRAAKESYNKSPFYQAWDPRVLERWMEFGLREVPTAIYPGNTGGSDKGSDNGDGKPVTLTSTLHQEVFTYARPNYDNPPSTAANKPVDKRSHPDLDPTYPGTYPFYRPEPARIFNELPYLRPSVLYVFGRKSAISLPQVNEDKMAVTGMGVGGSGGAPAGRVQDVYLEKAGHLVAQEDPVRCAEAVAGWLGGELERWRVEEEAFRTEWGKKSGVEKSTVDARWKEHVPPPMRKSKPANKL